MLPVQVQYLQLLETAKHNRETEDISREANRIGWLNAYSGQTSAYANERSSYANMQNAQTNARNADTNAYNALVNKQNADTNAYNAATNRMNAETQAYNVYELGTRNAESQRISANAASSQALSARKQASLKEQEYLWSTQGPGYDLKLRDIQAKELSAEAAQLRAEANMKSAEAAEFQAQSQAQQREHQNALIDSQTLNVQESTRRSKSEDTKGWVSTISNTFSQGLNNLLDISDNARGWFDAVTKRENSNNRKEAK